jgi:hypothetical protein
VVPIKKCGDIIIPNLSTYTLVECDRNVIFLVMWPCGGAIEAWSYLMRICLLPEMSNLNNIRKGSHSALGLGRKRVFVDRSERGEWGAKKGDAPRSSFLRCHLRSKVWKRIDSKEETRLCM